VLGLALDVCMRASTAAAGSANEGRPGYGVFRM